MHHNTCVTHVPWCMLRSPTRAGGENVPGIPGAGATRKFTYLARGPCRFVCRVIKLDLWSSGVYSKAIINENRGRHQVTYSIYFIFHTHMERPLSINNRRLYLFNLSVVRFSCALSANFIMSPIGGIKVNFVYSDAKRFREMLYNFIQFNSILSTYIHYFRHCSRSSPQKRPIFAVSTCSSPTSWKTWV